MHQNRMRYFDNSKIFLLIVVHIILLTFADNVKSSDSSAEPASAEFRDDNIFGEKEGRAIFSPQVDYKNEWLPVGRGDPLKKDPTFDYSPPVLNRVRYWAQDPSKEKNKTDVLLLGVTAKKPISKKKPYHHSIRRNFYTSLPSVLMPPPMTDDTQYSQSSSMGNNWYNTKDSSYYDGKPDGYVGYMSARPSSNMILTGQQLSSTYYSPSLSNTKDYLSSEETQMNYHYQYPYTHRKKPTILHSLLQKEHVYQPTTPAYPVVMIQQYSSMLPPIYKPTTDNSFVIMPSVELEVTTPTPPKPIYSETTHFLPTIPPPIIMMPTPPTSMAPTHTLPDPSRLTKDPLSSHYKQSETPNAAGPMYLIIEGHSKVKTYGQNSNNTKHEPIIVPITGSDNPVTKHVVLEDERGNPTIVKHLHTKQEVKKVSPLLGNKNGPLDSLISLLDTSFGNLMVEHHRNDQKLSLKTKLEQENKVKRTVNSED